MTIKNLDFNNNSYVVIFIDNIGYIYPYSLANKFYTLFRDRRSNLILSTQKEPYRAYIFETWAHNLIQDKKYIYEFVNLEEYLNQVTGNSGIIYNKEANIFHLPANLLEKI